MLQCDWCHKPLTSGKEWAYQVELQPFHVYALDAQAGKAARPVALAVHLHSEPCKDELGWAIERLLADREPLETDGPSDDDEIEVEESTVDSKQERLRERIKREVAWKRMPTAERERVLLHVLAGDQVTIREATERMRAELAQCDLYENSVRSLVMGMFKARELDRRADPRKKGTTRYCYFRRGLEGPIAELERTFHEPDEGERS